MQSTLIQALPEKLQTIASPQAPATSKIMAAKGIIPAAPQEIVTLLTLLTKDPDEKVSQTALQTLSNLPDQIRQPALEYPQLPGDVLIAIAQQNTANHQLLEKIILHNNVPISLIEQLAETVVENLVELISQNQQRILNTPSVALAIAKNPHVLKSTIDRVFDFIARSGIILDCPEYEEALNRLSPSEKIAAVANIDLPPEVQQMGLLDEKEDSQQEKQTLSAVEKAHAAEEKERKAIPMAKLINGLNTAQKIALALKGNKEARSILVKDSNRMVATSAIRSPRITEQEIVTAAQSRSVNDEVIRIIASSRDMTRSYAVKQALVGNPKTPLPIAMKMLSLLRKNDLKSLARSKNIPSALSNMAKKLASQSR